MKKITLFLLFPLLVFSQTEKSAFSDDELFVMFYNLENLFDTIDSPTTNDSEFLPSSEKKWNTFRYDYKLKQIEKVFLSISIEENNNKMPDVIGLCEVENRLVIKDLLKTPVFNNKDYKIVHQDSPDNRGIDCALLFNNKFKLLEKEFIKIENPTEKRPTRDIVYVKLRLQDKVINIFVNHWPSRWGGQEKSNHKRVFVAEVLKDFINLNTSEDEYTIIMGDFNDNFVNLMSTDLVFGKGSYNYKGNWNWLDQIIISKDT